MMIENVSKEQEPIAGKYLFEILTNGMYSNPLHIFREYIQNAADSIDEAVENGLMDSQVGEIHITINEEKGIINIYDNGMGIQAHKAKETLLSIGNSKKGGTKRRGFRGIGRLGGFAYAQKVVFETSFFGEDTKTIMSCNCAQLKNLLQISNHEDCDIIEAFKAISVFNSEKEKKDKHYFKVTMEGASNTTSAPLLDKNVVKKYLQQNAPIDFDDQLFSQAKKIRDYFTKKGFPLQCYNIYLDERKLPLYKLYSRSMKTGKQTRTAGTDFVRDVELVYGETNNGIPLYIGWLALTDFSGIITDPNLEGIRLRSGNIQVGDNYTFCRYFPSEGQQANRMFAGEIYVLNDELIPNSQRDEFEQNDIYEDFKNRIGKWAYEINKKYRRGTSKASSALRKLAETNESFEDFKKEIRSSGISSDTKREKAILDLEKIIKKREDNKKELEKALSVGVFDIDRAETVRKEILRAEQAEKETISLQREITDAGYSTKSDLPSSYGRSERKIYQRIIAVIDKYFEKEPERAKELHDAIVLELSAKRK